MKLSVIIPTYNRARTLRDTLETLSRQDFEQGAYEIIVVDNNSTDDTAQVVREFEKRTSVRVRYFHEPRPGVHYARNRAARNASGEILYYTDDDMLAEPAMLSELYKVFAHDPLIAIATGRVLPIWEAPPPDWVVKYCANSTLSLQLRTEPLLIGFENPGVWSCHQAIVKEVLMEAGGFHPENTEGTWVGDGETGLNQKVEERGYKFAFTAASVTHHVIPLGRMTQAYLNKRMANQGNADAYTWFRPSGRTRGELTHELRTCARRCVDAAKLAAILRLRGDDRWHLERAQVSYWQSRFRYVLRLFRQRSWREFVLKNNWIAEEG